MESPFKLGKPLALAVVPGPKSVNLEAAAGDLPAGAFEDWKFVLAAFPDAFLDPDKGSLISSRLKQRSLYCPGEPGHIFIGEGDGGFHVRREMN
jgi:hypothetical protein